MFNEARVQSLIHLNLTKFFRFREHSVSLDEVYGLIEFIFESMARDVAKHHKLTLDEYLIEVRKALQDQNASMTPLTQEFWIAQAHIGWEKAFADG